ncbi:MAG: stage III sporulation protein AB [Peptococcaceae bacterium BRH_c4b]|nr:MAG: stage III sporulation protein AB [Peptococcaceae bacterium BRH_c4b]
MLKLAGALLIIVAGGAAGIIRAREYMRRPGELKSILASLQMLETEITYAATPLAEALERVAAAGGREMGGLFAGAAAELRAMSGCTAAEAWQKSLQSFYPASALRESDLSILYNLGSALGISDRQDQSKHLRLASEQLKLEAARAGDEATRNVKMWNCMGFCGAAALVFLIY